MTSTRLRIAKGARRAGPFAPIDDAIAAIRAGRMIIVVDDEDRENEGDLTIAAATVTAEAINFMARFGRGQICLSLTGHRLDELEIPLAVTSNTTPFGTAFCVPIDAKRHVTTGISAADRAAISRAPATSRRCAPGTAACWCGRARPRPRWIWRAWQGSTRPASSAKS
jgi:3,4-dihydroxy-2-butanone 4-phosphate synthase